MGDYPHPSFFVWGLHCRHVSIIWPTRLDDIDSLGSFDSGFFGLCVVCYKEVDKGQMPGDD